MLNSVSRKGTESVMSDINRAFQMTSSDEPMNTSNLFNEYLTAAEHATERVATLIDDNFESKPIFCQMDMLREYKNDLVWQEMARWIRYEEAVEEGGQRWSKPHVASLMMEALQDLQNILSTCPVILDSNAETMREVADEVTEAWIKDRPIMSILKDTLIDVLLKPHKFQHFVKRNDLKKNNGSSASMNKFQHEESYVNEAFDTNSDVRKDHSHSSFSSLALGEINKGFMRHIPAGSEVLNLLVGEIQDLDRIIAAFIRIKDPCNLGYITEVDLNSKFMFVVLAPKLFLGHCAEMCRCMGAMFTDEIFRCVAYRCKDRIDLLCGIQEFSLHLTVLPPGVWDPTTRIEPPNELPPQDYRKTPGTLKSNRSQLSLSNTDGKSIRSANEETNQPDPTLLRTGRLFGGLKQDIKRKVRFYLSDFKDALHIQSVASFFFLFLATLTPNVTFGGLLGHATDHYMGTMECILAGAISGVSFALFSGQPLNILGSTGPMLVLEGILYSFCKDQDWDFLPFRVWVGFWTGLFILLIVAFDLSSLVRYITRFTEESFACLIALIFIYEAFRKTFEIEKDAPVHFNTPTDYYGCFCMIDNRTASSSNNTVEDTEISTNSTTNLVGTTMNLAGLNTADTPFEAECLRLGGRVTGDTCEEKYVADVFIFSLLLFFGTFFLAIVLVRFRHSLFFPTIVRENVSDFAVLISIIVMVLIDALCGLPTPKLHVPEEFKPTKPGRSWFINPISEKNPWWLMLVSAVPAILTTILIFMDQQITAVIVNRKENKLKKGSGYHLDMLVVGILVVILSLLGLPWFVAATVSALAHIMSLRKVSECTAPGEKPVFLGVREQRVTSLLVGIFSGLAVLITSILRHIPMPVLYGVFLYMGVAPLSGMQLIQRMLIVFMPAKYQPDYSFIRNVPIKKVHLFTLIQVVSLAVLWVVKSIKIISIAFPLMVLILCFLRKALDKIFTQRELRWLDDILPATPGKNTLFEIKVELKPSHSADPVKENDITFSSTEETRSAEIRKLHDEETSKRRPSQTFVCRTDIDRIKALTTEVVTTNRRQSLVLAMKRKQSIATTGSDMNSRKFSTPLMFARKMSLDTNHGSSAIPTLKEQHKKKRLLSLPASITDVSESEEESKSDTESDASVTRL